MKYFFACLIFLLFSFNMNAQVVQINERNASIHYRFSQPDPWGEDFWKLQNQDDGSWSQISDFKALSTIVQQQHPKEIFIRLNVKHSAESVNNFYFQIRHSGPFELFINGIKNVSATETSPLSKDYLIVPRRPENIGENLYAFHFTHTGNTLPYFEITIKQSPWVCTDKGKFIPKPVLQTLVRDAQICIGKDGAYYMTATTGDSIFMLPNPQHWLQNKGIQIFRSVNLKEWKSLGFVWTFDQDGTWNKEQGKFSGRGPARGIFAPEIKYHDGEYWINYSVNSMTGKRFFGIGLLHAKKPEGPYTEISPSKPLTDGFDSNIFTDDDGTPYMLKHGGLIARMKKDYSGLEEPFRHLGAANYPVVGYEGVFLFKHKGKYYLTSSDWNVHSDGKISYDSMIASADQIYGPYSDRYCAIRFGGHNGYFEDKDGQVYATVWCYPDGSEHWQKVSIVKMNLDSNGYFCLVTESIN